MGVNWGRNWQINERGLEYLLHLLLPLSTLLPWILLPCRGARKCVCVCEKESWEIRHDLRHESCCMPPSSLTPLVLRSLLHMAGVRYRLLAQQINELLRSRCTSRLHVLQRHTLCATVEWKIWFHVKRGKCQLKQHLNCKLTPVTGDTANTAKLTTKCSDANATEWVPACSAHKIYMIIILWALALLHTLFSTSSASLKDMHEARSVTAVILMLT